MLRVDTRSCNSNTNTASYLHAVRSLRGADFARRQRDTTLEAFALELSQFPGPEAGCCRMVTAIKSTQAQAARDYDTGCKTGDQKLNQPTNSDAAREIAGQIRASSVRVIRWSMTHKSTIWQIPGFACRLFFPPIGVVIRVLRCRMVRLLGRACHSSDWLTASTLFLFHFPCSVLRCIYFLLWELSAFFLTFLDSIGQLGLMLLLFYSEIIYLNI